MEFLAYSKNKFAVYFEPIASHAATHFEDTPSLKELVIEALSQSDLDGDYLEFDTDMGRIIGNTDGVVNDLGDEIVYAKRKNRDAYTPFNKSKSPQPSSILAMALAKISNESYRLESAWISTGGSSPPFPGEKNETPESKPYWRSHSLAWGTQEIQEDTLTSTCPW